MRKMILPALLTTFAALTPTLAWADCTYTRLDLSAGTHRSIDMVVDRDSPCTIFASAGTSASASGIASFLDASVARKPAHGVAGVASKHEWGYKPNAGYVGRDAFTVEMRYVRNTQTQPQTMRVDVNVTVR